MSSTDPRSRSCTDPETPTLWVVRNSLLRRLPFSSPGPLGTLHFLHPDGSPLDEPPQPLLVVKSGCIDTSCSLPFSLPNHRFLRWFQASRHARPSISPSQLHRLASISSPHHSL